MAPEVLIRFVQASPISLSLADTGQTDMALVAVSPKFEAVTGYSAAEAVGKNCRFLQPPDSASPVRQRMRRFLDDPGAKEDQFVLANMRKNATRFVNLVYLVKLRRPDRPQLILGAQFDATYALADAVETHRQALCEDLAGLSEACRDNGWAFLGSAKALSSSASLLARHILEH